MKGCTPIFRQRALFVTRSYVITRDNNGRIVHFEEGRALLRLLESKSKQPKGLSRRYGAMLPWNLQAWTPRLNAPHTFGQA